MADCPIKRALVSVTDKTGVIEFVKALEDEFGVEVISTGGTARVLSEAGVKVVPIEQYTGFPEMMDGRVKTLHPKVHGGLLARRDDPKHMAEAAEHGIGMIDLVVVYLYEFEKTVAKPDVTYADAIEHIDIGGPSMLRSAAKNAASVTVVVDPEDYDGILDEMRSHNGATTLATRRELQLKVYETTALYDTAIATWLADQLDAEEGDAEAEGGLPDEFGVWLEKADDLRYGENPQQAAAVYRFADEFAELGSSEHPLVGAEQIQGKPLSYNNYLDADAAWNLVREFDEPACVILKHQSPCGSAVAEDITSAYDRAFACDPKSAFGGIIACNREVPYELVEHFADENKQFVEVIIAPGFSEDAKARMAKRPNQRVLATGGVGKTPELEMLSIDGGVLVQRVDRVVEDPATFTVPTKRKPTDDEMAAALRLEGLQGREVQRHSDQPWQGRHWHGSRSAQPRGLGTPCLRARRGLLRARGRGEGQLRLRERRVLPVPRQRGRAGRARRDLHHPARWLQARRRVHRGLRRARHRDGVRGREALQALSLATSERRPCQGWQGRRFLSTGVSGYWASRGRATPSARI